MSEHTGGAIAQHKVLNSDGDLHIVTLALLFSPSITPLENSLQFRTSAGKPTHCSGWPTGLGHRY